jgi:hypothetical protein
VSAILAVDNLFDSVEQYPGHTVTAEEEPAGLEASRFAAGRRDQHASATTANSDWWLKATFDRVRAFDFVCLWDHNLAGTTLRVQASDDDYVSPPQTIFDAALPTTPGTGDVDDALGVLCEDGMMWLKRFPVRTAASVRLYSVAMGAGLKPSLNGLVGLSVSFDRDMGDFVDANDLLGTEERNEAGRVGHGVRTVFPSGALPIHHPTFDAYEQFRYHLKRYGAGSPAVLTFDEARAEQGLMVRRPQQRLGFRQDRSYFYPFGQLPFEVYEPREGAL